MSSLVRRMIRNRGRKGDNISRAVRRVSSKHPTFKVPAQPVRSTRADRADAHRAKMLWKYPS